MFIEFFYSYMKLNIPIFHKWHETTWLFLVSINY